ncbi:hypothetical protein C3V36_09515 [Lachnospiraceae bacterium oral taxon 500]|nr:hypothetical protein C3V36_09515 [Lachnospiraceae bacterium oral taxon 500]
MEDNVCRIIKISKEALLEFIYENFINQEEKLFDLDTKVGISNYFDINWETGEFLFLAHNGEDAEENTIPFPKDIDIKKVMGKLPDTTDSVLNSAKNYKELTFEELRSLSND